jgi:membrane protein required for colicin V production
MDFITLLDGIVIVVVLLSALLAMYRGFIREVLSIAAWVAAAAAAYFLYKPFLPTVKQYIAQEYVALGVAVTIIFVLTLMVVSYITMKISDFVLDSAFGPLDRTFGFLFGAARGLLLVVVAMLFFNWFIQEKDQPGWVVGAKSKPLINMLGDRLVALLPEDPEKAIIDRLKNRVPGAGGGTDQPADEAPQPPAGQRT